jgi:hypothetical protein
MPTSAAAKTGTLRSGLTARIVPGCRYSVGSGRVEAVAQARFLADTSVFARLAKPTVAAAFAALAAQGQVALCAPVAFELQTSGHGMSGKEIQRS